MTAIIPAAQALPYAPQVMDDTTHSPSPPDRLPLGQRLFDNVFLLLAAGLVVMLVLYTGWGLWEIASLPVGNLP